MVNQKICNLMENNRWHISSQIIRKPLLVCYSLHRAGKFQLFFLLIQVAPNLHALFFFESFCVHCQPNETENKSTFFFLRLHFFYFLFVAGPAGNFFCVKSESHIEFSTKCVTMTLGGQGVIINEVLKFRKLTSFKIHEL